MSIKVPLRKVKKTKKLKTPNRLEASVSPYDIILGKIELESRHIPDYVQILKAYEKECCADSRYIEAEMAKHKIDELKGLAWKVEKEKALNQHLKEKVEVEEAYLKEFNDFTLKWERKLRSFEEKVEKLRVDMVRHQKNQLEEALARVEEKYINEMRDTNNVILQLQVEEKKLAKQRKYIEAQKRREYWQQEKEKLAKKQKLEMERKKNDLINDFELRNKKEIELFISRINDMRLNLEKERKVELEKLQEKFGKIKNDLQSIHKSEKKRIENREKAKRIDLTKTGTLPEDESNANVGTQLPNNTLMSKKKKLLMKRINRLKADQ